MKYTEVQATNDCEGCVAVGNTTLCHKLPTCDPIYRPDDQDIIYIIDPDGEIEVSE